MNNQDKWIEFAIEIQSIAQAGLTYGKDIYDMERYTRLREIAAEMLACKTDLPVEKVNLEQIQSEYQLSERSGSHEEFLDELESKVKKSWSNIINDLLYRRSRR